MSQFDEIKNKLAKIIKNNGPEEEEYTFLDDVINNIDNVNEGDEFRELLSKVLKKDTIFGHTFQKPYGYAGDFLLIEKIYQKYESKNSSLKKWDRFYHSHEATEAVRNRKKYFIKLLKELTAKRSNLNVLILGCGPATDVYEFLCDSGGVDQNVNFDLVDIDRNAIEYASKKNKEYLDKVNFIQANVIKFVTDNQYDLIWSAGLFDYLDDKLFVFLLNRFISNLKDDGMIVIGNFSPANPTIRVMEVMTEWYLNYRDENHLTRLAVEAGIDPKHLSVETEPLGINLFLKIVTS